MKTISRLLVVILIGSLIQGVGLFIVPQSGWAQSPYTIKKTEPAGESSGKTIEFKVGKPEIVGSSQEEDKGKFELKVHKLISPEKGKTEFTIQSLTGIESKEPQIKLEPVKQESIKPELKLQVESIVEESEELKYKLKMEPVQREIETSHPDKLKIKSLEPAQKDKDILLKIEKLKNASEKRKKHK